MQMHRLLPSLPAILAIGFATAAANAAEKSQYSCRSGEVVRRVVIEVGDLGSGLPCEVVYWKDTEAPGVRRVLWNARSDAKYCEDKAAGLAQKLDNSGWQCEAEGGTAALNQTPAEPEVAAIAPDQNTPVAAAATPSVSPAESDSLGTPEPAIAAPALDNTTTPAQPLPAPTEPLTPAQTAALEPAAAPPPVELNDQLQSVIQQNLDSLNKSVDGDFKAEVGQFGDLNADGLNDAVVFFNYQSSTADFTQFVAAYLFNGDSYHLAATKPIGGTERAIEKVEVENIVDGSILLKLHLNDASQTENRSAAMTLKDGQLVEIE